MSDPIYCELTDRTLIRVSGSDARKFLHGLVTCEIEKPPTGALTFGALLTPQGKILFDFFILVAEDGFILDVSAAAADDLVRRLTFYKLRADVEIAAMEPPARVFAIWSKEDGPIEPGGVMVDGAIGPDPRLAALGLRGYLNRPPNGVTIANIAAYQARRITYGMPEGGNDFAFGDAFPHEALMDQFAGVDFTKGCYVGQEVVSRMQHRGTARKRIIRIRAETGLPEPGTEVSVAGKACGKITSVAGENGLALIRLDRALNGGEPTGDTVMAKAGAVSVALSMPDWVDFTWPDRDSGNNA